MKAVIWLGRYVGRYTLFKSKIAPTTLSWFPWRACLTIIKGELII